MSIVNEILKITQDEQYLRDGKNKLDSKVIKSYNNMLSNGVVKPRGNCLMPVAKLYTQNITFNNKR